MTYTETFSKNISKDADFFLNFSYFKPRTAPISGTLPSKLLESVVCVLLWFLLVRELLLLLLELPLLLPEAGTGVVVFPCSLDIVGYANVVWWAWNFDAVGIDCEDSFSVSGEAAHGAFSRPEFAFGEERDAVSNFDADPVSVE